MIKTIKLNKKIKIIPIMKVGSSVSDFFPIQAHEQTQEQHIIKDKKTMQVMNNPKYPKVAPIIMSL